MKIKIKSLTFLATALALLVACPNYDAPPSSLIIDIVSSESEIIDSCQLIVPSIRIGGADRNIVPQRTIEGQKTLCTWAINDLSDVTGLSLELQFRASCTDTAIFENSYIIEEHRSYGFRVYLGNSREFWPEQNVAAVRPGCWGSDMGLDSVYINISLFSTLRY